MSLLALLALLGLLGLGGCSTLRLGYSQADTLAYWWLDKFFDFTTPQTAVVKPALRQWHEWHRTQWLAEDAALLDQAAREIAADTTPAQVCRWRDKLLSRQELHLNHLVEPLADVLTGLGETQFKSLQNQFNRSNREWRDENLRGDADQRHRASVERVVDRADKLYGDVDAAQRRFISERLRGSPWDAQRWLQERQRQQRDTTETLRALTLPGQTRDQRLGLLHAWVSRSVTPTDDAARQYREQLASFQCELAAEIHNRTSADLRRHATERLQGWAQDLRSAAGTPAAATAPAGSGR